MKKCLALIILFYSYNLCAQVSNPFYQSVVANVSYDSVLSHLQHFESLGVKSPGSSPLTNTKNWLIAKYQAYGYTDIVQDNFTYYTNTLTNVVVTKTGSLFPDTYVIVCGHYDTSSGTGTNDNGSGVSILLEIARLLSTVSTEYSVRFINFSGEEAGLRGSKHYADDIAEAQGMHIRLVFNIDEVGGIAGMANNTISCERDQSSGYPSVSTNNAASSAYTDTLVTLTQLYSALSTEITDAYGSDYMPFEYNGEIITGYYENNESSVVHTSNDNLAHLDTSYVYQITKAAIGATLYFAAAYDDVTEISENNPVSSSCIYPNPIAGWVHIRNTSESIQNIKVYDLMGLCVAGYTVPGLSESSFDVTSLSTGLYIIEFSDQKGAVLERKKIINL